MCRMKVFGYLQSIFTQADSSFIFRTVKNSLHFSSYGNVQHSIKYVYLMFDYVYLCLYIFLCLFAFVFFQCCVMLCVIVFIFILPSIFLLNEFMTLSTFVFHSAYINFCRIRLIEPNNIIEYVIEENSKVFLQMKNISFISLK